MEYIADRTTITTDERKPYQSPAVIHELELETRAGTPNFVPNPLDPLGIYEDGS